MLTATETTAPPRSEAVPLTVAVVPVRVCPPVGTVMAAVGAPGFSGLAVLRGFGGPALKSAALSSVSTQPSPLRRAAVVFDRVGAGPEPS